MRGSWRANARAGEPTPPRGLPPCPRHLLAEQKLAWKAFAKLVDAMGVLTTSDAPQVERYAVMLVQWRRCVRFVEAKDAENAASGLVPPGCYPVWSNDADTYVIPGKDGVKVVGFVEYPAVKQAQRLDAALKQIEAQFGLTPAARVRLATGGGDEPAADPFTEFLNARKRA